MPATASGANVHPTQIVFVGCAPRTRRCQTRLLTPRFDTHLRCLDPLLPLVFSQKPQLLFLTVILEPSRVLQLR